MGVTSIVASDLIALVETLLLPRPSPSLRALPMASSKSDETRQSTQTTPKFCPYQTNPMPIFFPPLLQPTCHRNTYQNQQLATRQAVIPVSHAPQCDPSPAWASRATGAARYIAASSHYHPRFPLNTPLICTQPLQRARTFWGGLTA